MAYALLNQGVQKTERLPRLPRLSVTGKRLCAAALLLAFVTLTLHAGEPVMTLAIIEPSGKNSAASSLDLTPVTDGSVLNFKASRPETVSQIESPVDFQPPESSQLVHESSHPNKSVTVQAGYRRIWDEQSTLRKIACDHQETGCAYVSANFSF